MWLQATCGCLGVDPTCTTFLELCMALYVTIPSVAWGVDGIGMRRMFRLSFNEPVWSPQDHFLEIPVSSKDVSIVWGHVSRDRGLDAKPTLNPQLSLVFPVHALLCVMLGYVTSRLHSCAPKSQGNMWSDGEWRRKEKGILFAMTPTLYLTWSAWACTHTMNRLIHGWLYSVSLFE